MTVLLDTNVLIDAAVPTRSHHGAAEAAAGASVVAARNETDFENTPLTPYHPLELVEMIAQ